jgi:hypothetical protein
MITIQAPLKRSDFQTINFGSRNFVGVGQDGSTLNKTTSIVDEVLVANAIEGDPNQVDFIKRYNTWFVFTDMEQFPLVPYRIILIHYDRVARVAYTDTDVLKIVRKP